MPNEINYESYKVAQLYNLPVLYSDNAIPEEQIPKHFFPFDMKRDKDGSVLIGKDYKVDPAFMGTVLLPNKEAVFPSVKFDNVKVNIDFESENAWKFAHGKMASASQIHDAEERTINAFELESLVYRDIAKNNEDIMWHPEKRENMNIVFEFVPMNVRTKDDIGKASAYQIDNVYVFEDEGFRGLSDIHESLGNQWIFGECDHDSIFVVMNPDEATAVLDYFARGKFTILTNFIKDRETLSQCKDLINKFQEKNNISVENGFQEPTNTFLCSKRENNENIVASVDFLNYRIDKSINCEIVAHNTFASLEDLRCNGLKNLDVDKLLDIPQDVRDKYEKEFGSVRDKIQSKGKEADVINSQHEFAGKVDKNKGIGDD